LSRNLKMSMLRHLLNHQGLEYQRFTSHRCYFMNTLSNYLTVICDDTDETVNITDRGPSKPRAKKVSKQQREAREERKLELFSEAV